MGQIGNATIDPSFSNSKNIATTNPFKSCALEDCIFLEFEKAQPFRDRSI